MICCECSDCGERWEQEVEDNETISCPKCHSGDVICEVENE